MRMSSLVKKPKSSKSKNSISNKRIYVPTGQELISFDWNKLYLYWIRSLLSTNKYKSNLFKSKQFCFANI